MRDEIDSRIWAEHGPAFTADLHKALQRLWHGFERLNARLFAAPWRREEQGCAAE